MKFAHDTEVALRAVVDLVNTGIEVESLPDPAALATFLDEQRFSGAREGTDAELAAVHELRGRLQRLWEVADDTGAVVAIVNDLLAEAAALPRLVRHDEWDWHLHLTDPDAPLTDRMGTEAAMAIADLVRAGELGRLKRCAADDCDAVHLDLSRNRSKRYCDTDNCANRAHVAAYRARKARASREGAARR